MKLSKFALLTCMGLSFLSLPAMAQLDTTFDNNDVIFGFRATGGTGASTTIMVNLGAAATFRDTTTNMINFANIGSTLNATYGTGWADRTDFWAGLISATNGTNFDNTGGTAIASQTTDYNSTIYVSTRRTGAGTIGNAQSAQPGGIIPLDAQTIGLQVQSLNGFFGTNQSAGIVNVAASSVNSWNTFTTGSTSVDFGGFNVEAAFTAGNRGVFGAAGTVEQMWDFYRVANFPTTDPLAGKGVYQGTFTINNAGDVSFVVVPEPSTYALFALGAIALAIMIRRRKQQQNA